MKIVIEIPDNLEDDNALKRYLANMQQESDEAAAESPDDYWDGFGSLSLETRHMAVSARIVGFLHEVNAPNPGQRYHVEPINREGN